MTINNEKIVKRWDSVMYDICCEHVTINTNLSELESNKEYYGVEKGITVEWMLKEAKYWLSCYYEEGNIRCDDRHYDRESYKTWLSESGKLKRLIEALKKTKDKMVVVW